MPQAHRRFTDNEYSRRAQVGDFRVGVRCTDDGTIGTLQLDAGRTARGHRYNEPGYRRVHWNIERLASRCQLALCREYRDEITRKLGFDDAEKLADFRWIDEEKLPTSFVCSSYVRGIDRRAGAGESVFEVDGFRLCVADNSVRIPGVLRTGVRK